MSSFDVLDPQLELSRHYLLEASAGTGKTFSIENIILRLLLEGDDPLLLEQILAVTFTRAAVADMKTRVRANLRNILEACKSALQGRFEDRIPAFLSSYFEAGDDSISVLKRRLEGALAAFDQAPIYTIHSFCAKMLREYMLEGGVLVDVGAGEEDLPRSRLRQIVKDYLRTELMDGVISHAQLDVVIKDAKGFDKLVRSLSDYVSALVPIIPAMDYGVMYSQFVDGMSALKRQINVSGEALLKDFFVLAPYYKGVCEGRKAADKKVKAVNVELMTRFAGLFDKDEWDNGDFDFLITHNGVWNSVLDPKVKFSKFPALATTYPSFSDTFGRLVEPIVKLAGDPQSIFSILAAGCQTMGQRILTESEQISFNSLLQNMHRACQQSSFVERVRARFKAVIIDEFQDTDPLQWDIFRTLFPPTDRSWGCLYLVGDPKQSIYSFRQADIYTYLDAAQAIGTAGKATLNKNFRSEPSLIHALNAIFDPAFASNLIALPRLGTSLAYEAVLPGGKVKDYDFGDSRGSLHVMILEAKKYTLETIDRVMSAYIAQEIRRMHTENGFALSKFAILVADKYQAERVIEGLREWNIPATYQKAASFAKSRAVVAMRELLSALINPRDESLLKVCLGGPLIGMTHHDVRELNDLTKLQKILEQFYELRATFWNNGFARFLAEFLQTKWVSTGLTVEEKLLAAAHNGSFYNEWSHVCDWLVEKYSHHAVLPEVLIDELVDLETSGEDRNDLKVQNVADDHVVQVLSIHLSKGLEFDVVFPIGLYKRPKLASTFIPLPCEEGFYCQKAVDQHSKEYMRHCEEVDAELMRQLYVAMTRAKHRLYLPCAFSPIDKEGAASAMELFIARCLVRIDSCAQLKAALGEISAKAFEDKLRGLQGKVSLTFSSCSDHEIDCDPLPTSVADKLYIPPSFTIPGDQLYLKSYTLLSKASGHSAEGIGGAPNNFLPEIRSAHTLPAGSEVGILLHSLLENISFQEAAKATSALALAPFVHEYTKGTSFHAWDSTLAEVLYAALNTPLFAGVPPLSQIADTECYREMEFVYPAGTDYGFDGFLKGVIDLVFRYEDKYYLVDWKSNWLGPDASYYGDENMRKAMVDNDYLLQARIYRQALSRYIHLFNNDSIGGIAYVFLRGVTKETGVVVV